MKTARVGLAVPVEEAVVRTEDRSAVGVDPGPGHGVTDTVGDRDRVGGFGLARADGGDDRHAEDEHTHQRFPWPPRHVSRPLSRETLRTRGRVYDELLVKSVDVGDDSARLRCAPGAKRAESER